MIVINTQFNHALRRVPAIFAPFYRRDMSKLLPVERHLSRERRPHDPALITPVEPAHARRNELVKRVTAYLRDHAGEPVRVAHLSHVVGVSERTLRAAFQEVIGLSPKRYALTLRLSAARAALWIADPQTTTVTDIATTFGFYELGRFAGRYRHTFGEVPSRTLRQLMAEAAGGGFVPPAT
jgi:transcriptional regulator GlxA family with amidase domain